MDAIVDARGNAGQRERLRIRTGAFTGPTSGLAPGNVQANLVILPKALAGDFLRFAVANPKPCPILAVSEPGDPGFPTLGADLDIRTDLPRYRVWRNGELVDRTHRCPRRLARRPRQLRHRLLVFVRGSADRGRDRGPPHRLRVQRADVSDQHPLRARGGVRRTAGGVDAAAEAGGCDPRGADHLALPVGAWRAGASGVAGVDRHRRHRQAGLRRRRADRGG